MNDQVRKRLYLSGRVQGVWFRGSMEEEAKRIGSLHGFVRNLDDGRVEAVVQGPKDAVARLVEWAHRGPSGAKVDNVDVTDEAVAPGEKPFRVEA